MEKIFDYLEDQWNEHGIVPAIHTIEEALEEVISHEEALDIPNAVERFVSFIRPWEGVILYQLPKASAERLQSARKRIEAV